jgi:quinol monooxygenase YgiN
LKREISPITFARRQKNSKNETVGGLKIVQVKPGHEAELERLFAGLRAEMRAHEPGCRLYSLLQSRAQPGAIEE